VKTPSLTIFALSAALAAAPALAEFDPMVIGGAMMCATAGMPAAVRVTTIEATGWTRLAPADRAGAVADLAAAQTPGEATNRGMPLADTMAALRQELMVQATTPPAFGVTEEWFSRSDNGKTHALLFTEGAEGARCLVATGSDISRAELVMGLMAEPAPDVALTGGTLVTFTGAAGQGAQGMITFPDRAAFAQAGLDTPPVLIIIGPAP
jgi:hypothetical protein